MDTSEQFTGFIKSLDSAFIKNNIGHVDNIKIAKALKTIDPEIYRPILRNISENYLTEIESIMKNTGPVNIGEIEKTQKELIGLYRNFGF